MLRKSVRELNVVKGPVAMPTVEVQMESLEKQGLYLGQIVAETLSGFAAKNPKITATIYSYGTSSVNFSNELGYSEFLIVAGDEAVLGALGRAFAALRDVKSRYSEYIAPSSGIATYHIEAGRLWEVEDALTWYSEEVADDVPPEASSEAVEPADDNDEESVAEFLSTFAQDVADDDSADEPAPASGSRRVGRAARADASVGTIRRTIEELFGLPEGSVALCGPDGRALRGDALIKTLRRRWDAA